MIYVWCVIKIFFVNPLTWVFKHPKILILVAIAVAALIGYQACNRGPRTTPSGQQISEAQAKAPTVQEAPDVLQTYSRIYYLSQWHKVSDDEVILYSWYEWNGKKWTLQHSDVGVTFDKRTQGDFRLYKR